MSFNCPRFLRRLGASVELIWGEITGTLADQTDLQAELNAKAALVHIHDDRYYTESEITTFLAAKANTSHTHGSGDVTDFNEAVDDRAAALIKNGTGITWSYNDGAGTLTPTITITQYTDEMARDTIGATLTEGRGIDITVNDAGNTIQIDSTLDAVSGLNGVSGTHVDITIPSWANAFRVILYGVSQENASDPVAFRLGDGGGIEDTNYECDTHAIGGSPVNSHATDCFAFLNLSDADVIDGIIDCYTVDTATRDTWICQGRATIRGTSTGLDFIGSKVLSAAITTFRITSVSEANVFDNDGLYATMFR